MSEDRFRSLLEKSPFGIYRVSYDGRFLTVNPTLCAMVGYTEEELVASNIGILYAYASARQRLIADFEERPHGASVEVPSLGLSTLSCSESFGFSPAFSSCANSVSGVAIGVFYS